MAVHVVACLVAKEIVYRLQSRSASVHGSKLTCSPTGHEHSVPPSSNPLVLAPQAMHADLSEIAASEDSVQEVQMNPVHNTHNVFKPGVAITRLTRLFDFEQLSHAVCLRKWLTVKSTAL